MPQVKVATVVPREGLDEGQVMYEYTYTVDGEETGKVWILPKDRAAVDANLTHRGWQIRDSTV
ncbi:hypothetical protein OIE66_30735 [Nonomuraea sp. NBC_01738]|uniref:hypothetical protein n=1 Tax=Nonomuraea sp. NBC_01738 TaxID=2976003 RepID=UPI002E1387CE|nr:hypothetical protein OIE66_30735 [Nonomuraea sp. NBC_01738]